MIWPEYILLRPVTVKFQTDDRGNVYAIQFDGGIYFTDRRELLKLPIHLRPDVDPDDTVLDCWAEVDTELED